MVDHLLRKMILGAVKNNSHERKPCDFSQQQRRDFLFLAVILCNNILRKIYIIGVEVLGTNVSIKPGSTSYYVALDKLD